MMGQGNCRLSIVAVLVVMVLNVGESTRGQAPTPAKTGLVNPVFDALVQTGIAASSGAAVKLPLPILVDGASPAEQRRALESIADENRPLEGLLRKSAVSPFVLNIRDVAEAAGVRRVDLYFVVYASLERISDDAFLKQELAADPATDAASAGPAFVELTAAQLGSRGITSVPGSERFFAGQFSLFDRVRFTGAIHAYRSSSENSVLIAMRLDPRFDNDAEFPNRWQSLRRDDSGKLAVGPGNAYHAAGGYLKATRLSEPSGAVLIEQHIVFDEPSGWFDGANLLRSKLPIVSQDGVRKTRRRVGQ